VDEIHAHSVWAGSTQVCTIYIHQMNLSRWHLELGRT
jgi:hypothetical protein